ncbi:hypothetical protein GCM10011608_58660 [Micromonospora sonchi]|uniref:Uncharacterized protein n=1 Tax=Micromonospora sonchi TaxID=1763543 RepID=A0A917X549_9ACTN|nr:hypothetical protein [Micromonospora sonchi]GGM65682.1 hypothetical protein GCM10011608_58660 [Micromonospora sonchi]
MYIFDGLTASAVMRTQAEIDSVIRQLAKNDAYQPVLRSAGRELLRLTGAKSRTSQESNLLLAVLGGPRATHSPDTPMLGELFFLDGSAIIVQPMKSRLAIGEVRGHEKDTKLPEFAEELGRAAKAALDGRRLRGMSFEWLPLTQDWLRQNSVHYGPRNLVSPRSIRNRNELKTKPAALSMDDMEDATLLVRPEQRLFLQRLIQIGKARSVDARQDISAETVEPLLVRGLVNKEFLVVCRKDS